MASAVSSSAGPVPLRLLALLLGGLPDHTQLADAAHTPAPAPASAPALPPPPPLTAAVPAALYAALGRSLSSEGCGAATAAQLLAAAARLPARFRPPSALVGRLLEAALEDARQRPDPLALSQLISIATQDLGFAPPAEWFAQARDVLGEGLARVPQGLLREEGGLGS